MATIAEFTIPAGTFPLGRIFDEYPEVTIELERVIPTGQAIIPYCWVTAIGTLSEIELPFDAHPGVRNIRFVDEVDGRSLIRVDWDPECEGIVKAIVEMDVVLISGVGSSKEWTFELRADDQQTISAFQQYCWEHDIPVRLSAIHALSSMETVPDHDLTDHQREALILAYERGYYRSPREATLEEIGRELGITGQSLGSRLRRGTHRLIGSTLIAST